MEFCCFLVHYDTVMHIGNRNLLLYGDFSTYAYIGNWKDSHDRGKKL